MSRYACLKTPEKTLKWWEAKTKFGDCIIIFRYIIICIYHDIKKGKDQKLLPWRHCWHSGSERSCHVCPPAGWCWGEARNIPYRSSPAGSWNASPFPTASAPSPAASSDPHVSSAGPCRTPSYLQGTQSLSLLLNGEYHSGLHCYCWWERIWVAVSYSGSELREEIFEECQFSILKIFWR